MRRPGREADRAESQLADLGGKLKELGGLGWGKALALGGGGLTFGAVAEQANELHTVLKRLFATTELKELPVEAKAKAMVRV